MINNRKHETALSVVIFEFSGSSGSGSIFFVDASKFAENVTQYNLKINL